MFSYSKFKSARDSTDVQYIKFGLSIPLSVFEWASHKSEDLGIKLSQFIVNCIRDRINDEDTEYIAELPKWPWISK